MNYLDHFLLLLSFPDHTQGSSWRENAPRTSLLPNLNLTQEGLSQDGTRETHGALAGAKEKTYECGPQSPCNYSCAFLTLYFNPVIHTETHLFSFSRSQKEGKLC